MNEHDEIENISEAAFLSFHAIVFQFDPFPAPKLIKKSVMYIKMQVHKNKSVS